MGKINLNSLYNMGKNKNIRFFISLFSFCIILSFLKPNVIFCFDEMSSVYEIYEWIQTLDRDTRNQMAEEVFFITYKPMGNLPLWLFMLFFPVLVLNIVDWYMLFYEKDQMLLFYISLFAITFGTDLMDDYLLNTSRSLAYYLHELLINPETTEKAQAIIEKYRIEE